MRSGRISSILTALGTAALVTGSAAAADLPVRAAPAPAPEACKATLLGPSFGPTIKANPDPFCFPTPVGDIYVGGALSGYAYTQSSPTPFVTPVGVPFSSDRGDRIDFTNLQAWIQKADGPFQFFVQAGAYSIPGLGLPIYNTFAQTDALFTPLPIAYGKFVINDLFSVQGGRMPTLIGSEAPFTFQNINISRGLLFNQENVINQGVQVNFADGPWSASVAGTDGFFSGEITWFTGAVTYKLDDNNTFGVNGGLNLGRQNTTLRSLRYQFATPNALQNSGIFSANYTYSNGPLTITPYFQFTNVERDPGIGILATASTYSGAVLAAYSFTDNFSLGGRFEYIAQSGRPTDLVFTNLLYGPGSSALSITVTPTFTYDRFFLRGEYAHVAIFDSAAGFGFGRAGTRTAQDRFLLETGITF
ncbi:MAG: hypothetical protein JWR08_1615 [Enterovirga sp.]|nr:hypothetical protein [Enterovirga sp.]